MPTWRQSPRRNLSGVQSKATEADIHRTLGVGNGAKPLRKKLVRAAILVALVAIVLLAGRVLFGRRAPTATRYITADVAHGDLRVVVSATGTLEALGTVEVGSEVSGRVQSVHVDYNAQVTKGQVLAEIDPVTLKAEATQANAQLAASKAAVDTAQATLTETTQALERAETQLARGLVPTKDVETARAAHARAKASLESAKANAALSAATSSSASYRLTKTKILSPIDGIVLSRSISTGQTVAASFQTPVLFKLAASLSQLELHVQIDEADIGRVREGMTAEFTVDAYPDRTFASKVASVRNEAKTSSNVVYYEAILTVDNAERLLRPGMTATANITSELVPNALLVPNAALRFTPPAPKAAGGFGPPSGPATPNPATSATAAGGAKRKRVHVVQGTSTVPVDVTVGASDGTKTEVRETTLTAGAKVATDVEEVGP